MQILDCTVAEYHSRDEVSSTQLRHFRSHGPWSYFHHFVSRTVSGEESDELRLGTAFHLSMEQPDYWRDLVMRGPEHVPLSWGGGASKAELKNYSTQASQGKIRVPEHLGFSRTYDRHKEYEKHLQELARQQGKLFVNAEDYDSLDKMIESVHENPASAQYVGKGHREVPAVSQCDVTGLRTRALADLLWGDVIVDYKTTRHMTKHAFQRDATKMGYHYQGAFYRRVFGTKRHVIVAVRNEPPWETIVYEIPPKLLAEADNENLYNMARLALCYETGSWHTEGWGIVNELELV